MNIFKVFFLRRSIFFKKRSKARSSFSRIIFQSFLWNYFSNLSLELFSKVTVWLVMFIFRLNRQCGQLISKGSEEFSVAWDKQILRFLGLTVTTKMENGKYLSISRNDTYPLYYTSIMYSHLSISRNVNLLFKT